MSPRFLLQCCERLDPKSAIIYGKSYFFCPAGTNQGIPHLFLFPARQHIVHSRLSPRCHRRQNHLFAAVQLSF